jgi:glycosyl-4,4'-diaponeurosporenoate acyltransferase
MTALRWAMNILGWPLLQLGIASVAIRLPAELFTRDTWLTMPRHWERSGRIYREYLGIRRWERLLPDGAPWMGGFAKKTLRSRDPAYLAQFLLETRRAELAHWSMLACLPVFFLWNPIWARCVMAFYALAANLPCILAQRYNRLVLTRILGANRAPDGLP